MLNQRKIKFIVYILSSLIILINSQSFRLVNSNDQIDDPLYASIYRVPYSKVTLYAPGGERSGMPFKNAYDGSWENFFNIWFAEHSNGENFTSARGEVFTNFVNYVEFTFEETVTIDRVIYQPKFNQIGFPTVATFYYTETDNGEYIFLDRISHGIQQPKGIFFFSRPVTCKKLKFEFTEINGNCASATEFQVYQPEHEEITQLLNLYTDYAETEVRKNATLEELNLINETCKKNINYETVLYPLIKRAKNFLEGTSKFDPRKEFSTNPKAKNKIRRVGNIIDYIRNTLKMTSTGTNKQPTGIFGLTGDTITVYLSAKEGDKLPKIKFSQYYGHYGIFQSGDQDLKIGRNVFTFPNFVTNSYSYKPIPGGPIYIINPYTEDEQSEDVKVYIEGGRFFPCFKKGDDEKEFLNFLSEYMLLMEKEPSTYINAMELWGERMIFTVEARKGYNIYVDGKGPQHNLETWDEYFKLLLKFDGVKFDENEPYYDKRNLYININVRQSQRFQGAYAGNEHIGIFDDGWVSSATYINTVRSLGWGFAHEIGHTMDVLGRTVGENTNNMEAKYDECHLRRVCSRGNYYDNLLYLTPDVDNSLRKDNSYYWVGGADYNFLFWWQIETLFPGYWGRLDNMYRYNITSEIDGAEKQCYYASAVTGLNMSYYFDRYGFYLGSSEKRFIASKTSENFNKLMQKLSDDGVITNKVIKFWYLSDPTYKYIQDNNKSDSTGCYKNNKNKINIIKVFKVNDGYSLSFPVSTCEGHLGYEIYENDKVINFTYTSVFTDKIKYDDNYVPKYKIRAYDKYLESTDLSDSKSVETTTNSQVCTYNDNNYDSVADAVKEIPTDTSETYEITLKKNTYENQIEINANVVIKLDESESNELKISSAAAGYIFKINSGKTLTLKGNSENVKLVVDGGNIQRSDPLITNYGTLTTNYVKFSNNINTGRGGAIYNLDRAKLYIYDSLFENNKASYGGAVCLNVASGRGEFTNVVFRGNTAENGGAIFNIGTIVVSNCLVENNKATSNGAGIVNDGGGVMTVSSSQLLNNQANNGGGFYVDGLATIRNTRIENNVALGNGGGVFESGSFDKRSLTIEGNTIISNNTANNGGGFYSHQGLTNFNALSVYDNKADLGSNSYLRTGKLFLKNKNNKLEGEIYKSSDSIIYGQSGMFSLQNENKPLVLNTNTDSNEGEILLITPNSYTVTEDDLKLFSSSVGTLHLSDSSAVMLSPVKYDLTYVLNGQSTTVKCHYGEVVTLDYQTSEGKYVSKMVDNNGKTYNVGDKVTIYNSLTLTLEVGDSYEVTLDLLEKQVKYNVKPNSDLYLPVLDNGTNGNLVISHWLDEEGNRIFGGKANINKNNMHLSAVYDGYFYVKMTNGNERLYFGLNEGRSTFVIPKLNVNVPEGYDLKIEFNGKNYAYGQSVVVNENMNFVVSVLERKSQNSKSPKSLKSSLVVFNVILAIIILSVVAFFIYRFVRRNKSQNADVKPDIIPGVGLELKSI